MRRAAKTYLWAAAAALCASSAATAQTLDAETCQKLRTERDALLRDGIKENMQKGPAWAQQNLSAEQIGLIRHFIGLDERILFRCPLPPRPNAQQAKAGEDGRQDGSNAAQKTPAAVEQAAPPKKVATKKAERKRKASKAKAAAAHAEPAEASGALPPQVQRPAVSQ
jgi:hypothetical protein